MKEKTPLSHEVVCFQMLDFETSNSKLEVSKSNLWKITKQSAPQEWPVEIKEERKFILSFKICNNCIPLDYKVVGSNLTKY